ncbi:MAG: hypothetical protein JWP44_1316 [Mucilaginibacter sp.]|nr:hypothetical protein [Mucilaginibacter sp.]
MKKEELNTELDKSVKENTQKTIQNELKFLKLVENSHDGRETQLAILNALPPHIALVNEDGKIVAVNESWKKLAISSNFGVANFGIGYSYLTIAEKAANVDKTNGSKIGKGIKEVISGNKKEFVMEYAGSSHGEDSWFRIVVAPINDNNEKGVVILHINIIDRKHAEASLIKSEANLRSVFENTDLSIVLFDNDLKIVSFNGNAHQQSSKYFAKKLKIGNSAFKYFPKKRWPVIKEVINGAGNKGIISYETIYIVKDGGMEWFEVNWRSVVNQKGEVVGVILTLKNITEKKTADLEREKIAADLVKRINDLEQFTYIISHNLRSSVSNIKGLTNLLSFYEHPDPECLETLQSLNASVSNLDNVIIDLNQILQTGKQGSEKIEVVSFPILIQEITAELRPMILKNNADINCDFSEIGEILILKSYLYSIFQNLIVNSIKYRQTEIDPIITIKTTL